MSVRAMSRREYNRLRIRKALLVTIGAMIVAKGVTILSTPKPNISQNDYKYAASLISNLPPTDKLIVNAIGESGEYKKQQAKLAPTGEELEGIVGIDLDALREVIRNSMSGEITSLNQAKMKFEEYKERRINKEVLSIKWKILNNPIFQGYVVKKPYKLNQITITPKEKDNQDQLKLKAVELKEETSALALREDMLDTALNAGKYSGPIILKKNNDTKWNNLILEATKFDAARAQQNINAGTR